MPPRSYRSWIDLSEFTCIYLLHSPGKGCLLYIYVIPCFQTHLPLAFHNSEIGLHGGLPAGKMLAKEEDRGKMIARVPVVGGFLKRCLASLIFTKLSLV